MRKLWLMPVSLVLAVILVGTGGCTPANTELRPLSTATALAETISFGERLGLICSQQNVGLWVTGEGKAVATPDIAMLRLGIEAEADTVARAQREATETMDKVMKTLKSSDVSEKDIQTQRFGIYPVRRWLERENKEEITGYRVTNIVIAKIREIDKTGAIIDAVAEAGGNLTRIESISFTVDDPTPYYREAREKAVEAAIVKAEDIAAFAGVEVGELIYISEGTAYAPQVRGNYRDEAMAAAPSPTPISPGELEFRLTVQMVYKID